MSQPAFFLGIDGGGTKTDIAVVNDDGTLVSRVQGPTSNKAVIGAEAAVEVLRALVDDAMSQSGAPKPVAAGWIGLAGTDRKEDKELFQAALRDRIVLLRVTNDAELVLSGNPDGIGIALIGGTGSIAFASNEAGLTGRSGGWGHIFGDEGSAWQLGVDALRAVAAATDGRGPGTSLTGSLLGFWRAHTPGELILRVYDPSVRKSDVAASAPLVVQAARDGDPVAMILLESAASQLATLVRSLLQRIPFSSPPSIAVTGGLLLQSPEIREQVSRNLIDQPCQHELVLVDDVAVSAAQAIRRHTMKGT